MTTDPEPTAEPLSPQHPAGGPASPVHEALENLRQRAEKRRQLTTAAVTGQGPEDLQRLVQELQTNQIELEMQYEEVLLAQAEAQAARNQYVDLYDFAPVGYFTLDAEGVMRQLNLCGAQQLGAVRQRLQDRRFALFVAAPDRDAFGEFLDRVFATSRTQYLELRLRREDSRPLYAQLEGLRVDGPAGPQCRLVLLDVTQRHEATEARRAAEARFRATFEQSNDGMLLLRGHSFVDLNAAALRLLGASDAAQVVGQPLPAFWPEHQPDGHATRDRLNVCLDLATSAGWCRIELWRRLPNGRDVWDEFSFSPVLVEGRPLTHAIWRDITSQRTAREQLRASEERLQLALAASETGIFTSDVVHNRLQWDARARAVFGQQAAPDTVPLEVLKQAFHPDDAARVWAAIEAALADKTPLAVDYRVRWPDGTVRYVSSAGRAITGLRGELLGFAGVLRDVTALHAAEEEARARQLRMQLALTASGSGVWEWELTTNALYWDARAQAIFGHPFDKNPVPFPVFEAAVHPDDRATLRAGLQQAIAAGTPFDLEHRVQWPDGSVRNVTTLGRVLLNEQGQAVRLTGILRDITSRRATQEQLRREKEFSESLLQHSIDGIAAFDRTGRVTAWNAEVARISRLSADDVIGRAILDVYPRFNTPQTSDSVARVLAGEQVALLGLRFSHREGEYDTYLVPLSTQPGQVTGVLAIVRDVTERNRLAEEATRLRLRQQQEVLAAILETQETERKRIAEALHNGLGQVLYATKLSLESKARPAGTVPTESLKLLNEAIHATRTISFELTPGVLEDFGLRVALEELVRRISPRDLPVHLHLQGLEQPLPAPVNIAVYRIIQELLNNVLKHAQATEVAVHVVREAGLLEVTVEDNGTGFSPQLLAAQPLAGIGLASIRNRVALLSGTLTLTAEPGRGTIVSLELPL